MQFDLFDSRGAENISLDEVFEAYYDCRKNKRRTANALKFELDFERELVQLWHDINSNNYKIGRSIAFIVRNPVQREVFAANFRDRIVHHLVINKINHLFEDDFIFDSYSCRKGKGVLCGVRRLKEQIEQCSRFYERDCYILKLDIRSFFMSIDKRILFKNLKKFIAEKYHFADKPVLLRLIKQIVFYNPEDNCLVKGNISDWNGLPFYKSLFWSSRYCGLPIGNLTSQVFANFYLNKLDKFVCEVLGAEYYGRYVDDFFIIHQDKEFLLNAAKKIDSFLSSNLRLSLHPQKFYLQHYKKGVRFVGAVVKPERIYIGNRTKGNLYQKISLMLPKLRERIENKLCELGSFATSINSYLGFMRHYNTYNLRTHILQKLDSTFLGRVSDLDEHARKFVVKKEFKPSKAKQVRLQKQHKYRKRNNSKRYKYLIKEKEK